MKFIELLQDIRITVNKKEFHKVKLEEVRNLLNKIYDNTGYYWLLPERNNHFLNYSIAVNNYTATTKKELDKLLKMVIKGSINEIRACIKAGL